jgi:hypothetical protein
MHTYKLKFEANEGDMTPKSYESSRELEPGEVIQLENGNWHFVMDIRNLKTGTQLVLAEAGQSARQAATLGRQLQDD